MRPGRAQPVVVRLPGRDAVPAYVTDADEACVTVVLAVRTETVRAPEGTEAVVEYATASGIHRLTGTVDPTPDPGTLRVQRNPPEDEHIQRRAWARVDVSLPIDVHFLDLTSGTQATVAFNLSGGGALIDDPLGLPLGARLRLRIHLDQVGIDAEAVVVREAPDGAKGVQITAVSEGDRERIVRFVAERQRLELARRRRVPA